MLRRFSALRSPLLPSIRRFCSSTDSSISDRFDRWCRSHVMVYPREERLRRFQIFKKNHLEHNISRYDFCDLTSEEFIATRCGNTNIGEAVLSTSHLFRRVIHSTCPSSISDLFVSWWLGYAQLFPYSSSEEKLRRFEVFKRNHAFIVEHNAKGNYSWQVGLNQFCDLTPEDFFTKFGDRYKYPFPISAERERKEAWWPDDTVAAVEDGQKVGDHGNKLASNDGQKLADQFDKWCRLHDKEYPSEEERVRRFEIFKKNHQEHKMCDGNDYCDLTPEEFIVTRCGNLSLTVSSTFPYSQRAMIWPCPSSISELFDSWCRGYKKSYSSEEERLRRFEVFKRNHAFIVEHNSKGNYSWPLGLNEFCDLTLEEFLTERREFSPPDDTVAAVEDEGQRVGDHAKQLSSSSLPQMMDSKWLVMQKCNSNLGQKLADHANKLAPNDGQKVGHHGNKLASNDGQKVGDHGNKLDGQKAAYHAKQLSLFAQKLAHHAKQLSLILEKQ